MLRLPLVGLKGAGLHVLIDDQDFSIASAYRWSLIVPNKRCPHGRYAQAWIPGLDGIKRRLTLHRFLLAPKPGEFIDHINGDGLDNRRSNLRIVTHNQNQQNRRGVLGNEHKGVRRTPHGRWTAQIEKDGEARHLGTFDTCDGASQAYRVAAQELFGEFAFGGA